MAADLRPGRIRDPVHDYVAFTAIERALLDHPIAQRLRHITQSAAAHLVFPEMRVSRMAHSLGAMHLASRFLQATLENAAPAERARILAGCRALVARYENLGLGDDVEAALERQGLRGGRERDRQDRVAVMLVEQALRLASLVHDLGHLPFSHDFEMALEVFFRANPTTAEQLKHLSQEDAAVGEAVHERVGYALAGVVQKAVFQAALADTPLAKPAEVALQIAREILTAPPAPQLQGDEHAPVISWLHSLVAGEVDVDRADYVLRDVRHYALAAAGYDLNRLVDNLVPVSLEDGRIETAILPQGVSAAEAFLVARFSMYAWAVYHHKTQQAAAGLRVAIEDLLAHGGPVRGFLDDLEQIASGRADAGVLDRFADYDDPWWTLLMRERLHAGTGPLVEPWLALFARRRPGPVSLWKRGSDFPVDERARFNARIPEQGNPDHIAENREWDRVRGELRGEGVLLERLPFRPWKPDAAGRSRLKVLTASGLQPLTRLSSLSFALNAAWLNELQVLAFADRPGRITADEVIARIEPALRPQESTS